MDMNGIISTENLEGEKSIGQKTENYQHKLEKGTEKEAYIMS